MKYIKLLILIFVCQSAQAQWTLLSTNASGSFKSLEFVDDNVGFVSTSSTILRTLDGGETWKENSIPASQVNRSMTFFDSLYGYIFTDKGTLYKTQDGGVSWDSLTDYGFTGEIHFLNKTHGFLFYKKLYSTKDGGATWAEHTFDSIPQIQNVFFPSSNTGYAISNEKGWVAKTTDGGTTWIEKNTGFNFNFEKIYFTSEKIGYITGGNYTDEYILLKTIDGGETWTSLKLQVGNSIHLNHIGFADDNKGYVTSSNMIFGTLDGGQTWFIAESMNVEDLYVLSSGVSYVINYDKGVMKNTQISGINETKIESNSLIYPNPCQNRLNISSEKVIERMDLIGLNGQVLTQVKGHNRHYSMDLNNLINGIYFVRIEYEDETIGIHKLVKGL